MHKNWKKTTAGVLSLCLISASVQGISETAGFLHIKQTVQANSVEHVEISGMCGEQAKYEYNEQTKTLTISGTGSMYDGYENEIVTEMSNYHNLWSGSPYEEIITQQMENVIIGDEITEIGAGAFKNCKALKEVKLGKMVKKIDNSAFEGCTALTTVHWTENLEEIGMNSFLSCNRLTKLYVGKSLKEINGMAFRGCNKLKQVTVHKENKSFSVKGNSLMNKKQTQWILGCFGADTTCRIYSNVTELNEYAIEEETIENFKVSSKNKKFSSKNGLLYSKNGKTLYMCPRGKKGTAVVSDKATKMQKYHVFKNCSKLEKIVVGKNIKVLDYYFWKCDKLKKVEINKKNKYYTSENGAIFSKNKKKLICCISTQNGTYTVPKKVTTAASDAFNFCDNLKHIVLSDNIKTFEPQYLSQSDDDSDIPVIESITLGKKYYNGGNLDWLADVAGIKNIYVAAGNSYYRSVNGIVYSKDGSRLVKCPQEREGIVNICTGTAIIGKRAFEGCDKVIEIVIPDTVTIVEKEAFGSMALDETLNCSVVFWVPAGKKGFYENLFTSKTGFKSTMTIKEAE